MKLMKYAYLLIVCTFVISVNSFAADYYIRVDGSDANSGKSNTPEAAWQTLDFAFSQIRAGDQLFVFDGVYITEELVLKGLIGTPEKITRIAAINQWNAVITQDNAPEDNIDLIRIDSCAYLIIDGFEVTDPVDKGVGITVRNGSHHVTVKNCYVHDCGCNGISSRTSDYLTFEGNVVRGNARRSVWNCSGISIWHAVEYDQEPGFHIVIRNNVAFENECELPFSPLGHEIPMDGNGIIIDDFRTTQVQFAGQKEGYKSAVLLENNLAFNNGGRGLSVFESENVTIRHNTSFHNMRVISKYKPDFGDITIQNASNISLYNNIIVKNPDLPSPALAIHCYSDATSGNNKIYNNIVVGENEFCGINLLDKNNTYLESEKQEYPMFKNPVQQVQFNSVDDFKSYFGLQTNSPAIHAGF